MAAFMWAGWAGSWIVRSSPLAGFHPSPLVPGGHSSQLAQPLLHCNLLAVEGLDRQGRLLSLFTNLHCLPYPPPHCRLSEEMAAWIGKPAASRPEITKFFWAYCKERELQVGC